MIVPLIVAFSTTIVAMAFINTILKLLGVGGILRLVFQTVGVGLIAYLLFNAEFIGIALTIGMVITPIVISVFYTLFMIWVGRRALNGDLGKESQWASELIDERDAEFITATRALPEIELKEVAILSESKEELREMTVERYEELK